MAIRPRTAYAVILAWLLGCATTAHAQIRGIYTPGMNATNSAVLPEAGITYQLLFQLYTFDTLKGRDGNRIPVNAKVSLFANQNVFVFVTKHKILGATYGFIVDVPVGGSALSTAAFGAISGGASLADSYYAPLVLGWSSTRWDVQATAGFFAPTGRFTPGGVDNTGVGYWGLFPTSAQTIYLTKDKLTQFSAYEGYEFHTDQEDTDIHPGQTFDLDYSLTRTVPLDNDMNTLLQVGLVGYGQYQTTAKSGPGVDPIVAANTKYRVNALGIGANVILPMRKVTAGVKWYNEFANRSTVEGDSLQISATISF